MILYVGISVAFLNEFLSAFWSVPVAERISETSESQIIFFFPLARIGAAFEAYLVRLEGTELFGERFDMVTGCGLIFEPIELLCFLYYNSLFSIL